MGEMAGPSMLATSLKRPSENYTMNNTSKEEYPKVYLYRRIVQAKLFIDSNYAERIDIDNISDEAHFSKYHFIRLFKEIYGTTPHQYLKNVRIEQAQQILKEGKFISDACFSAGFESLPSFSGLFKKIIGQSPSSYVKQYRNISKKVNKTPLAYVPSCFTYQHGWLENRNFEEVAE